MTMSTEFGSAPIGSESYSWHAGQNFAALANRDGVEHVEPYHGMHPEIALLIFAPLEIQAVAVWYDTDDKGVSHKEMCAKLFEGFCAYCDKRLEDPDKIQPANHVLAATLKVTRQMHGHCDDTCFSAWSDGSVLAIHLHPTDHPEFHPVDIWQ